MSAPVTEAAINKIRDMISSGALGPGQRLPPEPELAALLGLSRNTAREAVRALATVHVLDVRRGDGTYVTSLRPELLFQGIGFAVDLMDESSALELVQVRGILEAAASALAAARITAEEIAALRAAIAAMREAGHDLELMLRHDEEFHRIVGEASGNETLASMLRGISGRTLRIRLWRGAIEDDALHETIRQHEQILAALEAHAPDLAEAAARLHVGTSEEWVRRVLAEREADPVATPG